MFHPIPMTVAHQTPVRCAEDNFIFRQRLVDNTWASRPPKIEHERLPPLGPEMMGPRHFFWGMFSEDMVKFGDSNFFTLGLWSSYVEPSWPKTMVVKPVSETVSADIGE